MIAIAYPVTYRAQARDTSSTTDAGCWVAYLTGTATAAPVESSFHYAAEARRYTPSNALPIIDARLAHLRFRLALAADGGRRAWARALLRPPRCVPPGRRRAERMRRGTTFVRRD